MKKNIKHLLVSTTILSMLLVFAPASNAALILSTGPGTVTVPLPVSGNDFNPDMQPLGYSLMTTGAQLSVDQDGSVTFRYIAAESGFTNSFNTPSGTMSEANDPFNFAGYNSLTADVTAGDILNFNFTSAGSGALSPVDNYLDANLQGMGIFTIGSGPSHDQIILGYDDQWKWGPDDDNHDDMMVRVDFIPVNPVPVPAALWLFGSGLIGLIGIARQKKQND